MLETAALSVRRYRAIVHSEQEDAELAVPSDTIGRKESSKPNQCHCKNSNCLKLYCVCFKEGESPKASMCIKQQVVGVAA